MNKTTEALKMAIEVLESMSAVPSDEQWVKADKAINACKEALESQEQEPVAWIDDYKNIELELKQWMIDEPNVEWHPLYTHPAQPSESVLRRPLSDDEIMKMSTNTPMLGDLTDKDVIDFARAIEAYHGIK